MVNLTGAEPEKSEDLTQVSETGLSLVNSSHKSVVQLNNVCKRLKQPTSKRIRKLSQADFNSSSQSTHGYLETTRAYPAENEVVAEATQWEQRIEDILIASEALKQSESFLSDFSSVSGTWQNTELDEEKAKHSTSLEPRKTPESSPDVIQATPLEASSLCKRKKVKKYKLMVQASNNINAASNIRDGSDSEIFDMHDIGLPTKKWKKHRKNSVNNVSDASVVGLRSLDQSEPTVKTSPQAENPKRDSFSKEYSDDAVDSDIPLKQSPKHNGSLLDNLDESEILMKKNRKKWKKSNFSALKETNCDERDEIEILRRRIHNNASNPPTTNPSNSELADENKILRRKRSKKHKKNKFRKKRTLDEIKPDDEEIDENTGRSEAIDSCESNVEASILNSSNSNWKGESRAKRKINSEAEDENYQKSTTIRGKKRRFSSDEEAEEASDHLYEDAGPNESDAALKIFLGLKEFNRDFKVPRLHKIVDRASKPTADQRERIAEKGIEVKTVKFSSAEDQQIQENWRHFIQVFRLKDQPQKFFCLHAKRVTPEAKRTFLFYLARGFPNRTPYSVFKRFKLLMDRITKGRFSQEEDEFILKAIEGKPKIPITEVAKHLHRSLRAVSCRISKLKTTYSRKIKWSGRNAASYIKYLLEATDIDEKDIGLLKNRQITAEEWSKLSEKLDNVPVRILKPVWLNFLHPALFIPGNSVDLSAIKWKLAKRLHKNNETEWSCVDWTKYVERFEGFTSLKLYTLLKQLIKTHVPEKKKADLHRSLKHLMKKKSRIAAQPLKLLYKIKYRNGEIQDMRLGGL